MQHLRASAGVCEKNVPPAFSRAWPLLPPLPPNFNVGPSSGLARDKKERFFSQPRALELWSPTTLRFGGEGSADCRGETSEERFFRRHRTQYIMLRVLGPGRLRGFCVSELCKTLAPGCAFGTLLNLMFSKREQKSCPEPVREPGPKRARAGPAIHPKGLAEDPPGQAPPGA